MTDDAARKPDRDGIPGVDREGEYKDKDVPPTGDAPEAPRRVGGFEDKDVRPGEVGEKAQRRGDFSDKDVRPGEPGQEVEPQGEYKDKDADLDELDENDARGRETREGGSTRDS
jgi:hypothetical protein